MTFLKTGSVVALLLTFAAWQVRGQEGDSGRSIRDGVFSATQAEKGKQAYEQICLECHQTDEFVGPDYMNSWTGAPVSELFDLIQSTMPDDNPGSLRASDYAAILAYLFSLNGMPSGEADLKSDSPSLERIVIDGPYAVSGNQ